MFTAIQCGFVLVCLNRDVLNKSEFTHWSYALCVCVSVIGVRDACHWTRFLFIFFGGGGVEGSEIALSDNGKCDLRIRQVPSQFIFMS